MSKHDEPGPVRHHRQALQVGISHIQVLEGGGGVGGGGGQAHHRHRHSKLPLDTICNSSCGVRALKKV